MAGHSQFKNIMHRKGAQDKKRAKVFNRISREIIVAARDGGPDPASNPRLRLAVQNARAENMPKDRIENAINKGAGNTGGDNYEAMRYEGYGPGGVAILVEALTDNKNRTASEVRAAFSKHGGNLGESGSVAFMFNHVGMITYPPEVAGEEAMLEAAIEAGAENCESDEYGHTITCAQEQFGPVRESLEASFGEAKTARLAWEPVTTTPIDEEQAQTLMKLIDALEDNDDVQQVTANFEVDDAVLKVLSA